MNMYLVEGEITRTPYMERSITTEVTRLVKADSPQEAEQKFTNHYESESDPYGRGVVYVEWCDATGVIE